MIKDRATVSVDWQSELRTTAFKYHSIVAWVAVIFNPVFGITDFYTIPSHFTDFFIFRSSVSLAITIVLLFRNKLKHFPELIAFVPFVGISVQNAYMYSVMDVVEFQKHTFAYLALFIGAGMFVIWKPIHSVIVVVISFVANFLFFYFNSILTLDQILINGGLLTASVASFTIILINTRTNLTRKEIVARLALAQSNIQLAEKNEIIEEKNKNISDSINYARHIQNAILPTDIKIGKGLKDYFILYKPKDVVSGDFYWFTEIGKAPERGRKEDIVLLAAVDCTGHGVPGALMSIIGSTILNQISSEPSINTPGEALTYLNKQLAKNMDSIQDGMDMSFCAFHFDRMELQFAGANNPIYIVRENNIIELKPDKMAIGGGNENMNSKVFTNTVFQLQKNDSIYMFTDGYADQFGGPNGKKYKYKNFQKLLLEIQDSLMDEQKHILNYHHEQWKGKLEQVDDVLVIGIKV